MKADLILPIDSLRGMLRKDGYYFRMYQADCAAVSEQKRACEDSERTGEPRKVRGAIQKEKAGLNPAQ